MTVVVPNTLSRTLLSVALASCFGGFGTDTQAGPTAPTVAAGQASFAQNGKTLSITNTPGTVINWQGFSIAQDETTRFIQQSATSAVLNRVTGSTSSSILGQLQSNGQVFLINPNGIVVGPTGRIDTAGFVASSLDLKDADFISRRFKFEGSDKAGKVINQGEISTPAGGKVWLIAPSAENSGMITTPEGQIILAAGKKVTIADSRYPSVFVEIQAPDGEAVNLGQVIAKSGQIGMFGRTVKNTGRLNANAAVIENGKVVFKRRDLPAELAPTQIAGGVTIEASDAITLGADSQISADGPQAGEIRLIAGGELAMKIDSSISANGVQGGNISAQGGTLVSEGLAEARGSDGPGGRILLLGERVALLNRSRTDASGELGGGVVLVGGDYQGKNPDVMNATATYIGAGAEISADASAAGDGGKVVVWSNEATRYNGTISARGGNAGGDGGFVEVSGKNYLNFNGTVDTSAPLGSTGSLLLDPTNIYIAANQGNATTAGMSGVDNSADVSAAPNFVSTGAVQDSLLTTGTIVTALATNNVTVTTSNTSGTGVGNITVVDAITYAGATGRTLQLNADNAINVNATVSSTTAPLALNLNAGSGGIAISAAGNVDLFGGTLTVNSPGAMTQNAASVISGTTALTKAGAGTLTLSGTNTYTGATTISDGVLSVSALADGGVASNIGQSGNAAANLVLNGGKLQYTGATASTDRNFTLTSGTTSTVDVTAVGNILTISGASTATTGALTKVGAGTLELTGANLYSGATTINAGVLSVSSLANGGAASGIGQSSNAAANLVLGGGTLQYTGATASTDRNYTLTAGTASTVDVSGGASTLTLTGASTATTGALAKAGSGTLQLSGTNLSTGTTTVNAGTLRSGANDVLATGAVTVNDGGTYDLNGFSDTIGALTVNSGATGGTVTTGAGTLTLGGNVTSTGGASNATINGNLSLGAAARTVTTTNLADGLSVAAVVSGAVGLSKAGSGTLTLSGANTYTGLTTISAGTLKLGAAGGGVNTPLGTTTAGTTVASGAVLDLNGFTLGTAEALTLNGTGIALGGALTNSSATGVNYGGLVTLAGNTSILTNAGDINLTNTGTISGAGLGLTLDGSGNGSIASIIGTVGGTLTKNGSGSWNLTGANTYTGATTLNGGGLRLSGANGATTGASAYTLFGGTTLTLDNSGSNNNARINDASAFTMRGGELVVMGNAGANTTETVGALTLSTDHSTVTLMPDAGMNTRLTFASLTRTAGATGLFRGTNLGNSTVASQAAGESNIVFTAAPALTGGAGAAGTSTVSIVTAAVGAGGVSGSSSAGTDFLTYNPSADGKGLRPLASSEYTATPGTNVNLKLTANRAADDTFSVNSLLLSGGVNYDFNLAAGANTLTVASGNILSTGGSNSVQTTQASGALAFGAVEAKVFANTDLTLDSNTIVTGTGGVTKSGTGVLLENRATANTGGLVVNQGTLRSGVASAFAAANAATVRSQGTFDLNGNNNTVASLTMDSGATTGATVSTGAGTLSLGGNVALNANGLGVTGGTISGNLALNGGNRTFTVANGTAAKDLTVSALISGAAGNGILTAGAGTMLVSADNTYTGTTSVGGTGTLKLGGAGGATNTPLGTVAGATTVVSGATLDLNGFTLATAEALTLNGAGTTTPGALANTSATAATYSGLITLGSASSIFANNGDLVLSNAGTIAGTGFGLTLGGTNTASSLASSIGTGAAGALTKSGTGTWTISGATSNYTGVTTIGAGTLKLGTTGALGTIAGITTVTAGATLDLNGFTLGTAEPLTLNGTGVGGTAGALTNGSAAAATYSGLITLGSTGTSIIANNGNLVLSHAGTITGSGFGLTLGGSNAASSLASIIGTVAGTVTKAGTGTWTLSGTNTYAGLTTVNAGTLKYGASNVIANAASVTVNDGGTLDLNNNSDTFTALTVNSGITGGTVSTGTGALTLTGNIASTGGASNALISGNLVFGATRTLTTTNAADGLTVAAAISGAGGVTKAGAGTLTLSSGNSSYTGLTTVGVGTVRLGASGGASNSPLGTTALGTTVTNGAVLDLNGFTLGTAEALTLNGTGIALGGALTNNSATAAGYSGLVALGATAPRIVANAGDINLTNTGTITGAGIGLTLDGSGNGSIASIIGTVGGALTKNGSGSWNLTGANTYTGATTLNGGGLRLSGANGATTGASAYTLFGGTTLTLDNSGSNNNARIADTSTFTMRGGELVVMGNAGANTTETVGALTLSTDHSTVTLMPDAGMNTRLTFLSLTRTAGATGLFRGTNLGNSAFASNVAGESNIVFTGAPALTGGGGAAGSTTMSIVAGAIGAGGVAGAASSGTDFLTYNAVDAKGLRPLDAVTEYAAAPAANVNLKLTASRVADDTFTINSLLLSGAGVNYDFNSTGVANTLTVGSGNILSVGGGNSIQTTLATGALAFGAVEAKVFANTDLTLGSNTIVTGTGGVTKSGTGVLLENRATANTGGLVVNQGTLQSGIASAFAAANALTVRSQGTFDLNGNNNTVASLTMDSGAVTGATVSTGAGTLSLGGNVALNLNGLGVTGGTISGNLGLNGGNRTFNVTNGTAANDLSVSAIISGSAGNGIATVTGTGTLLLSGANTYTGLTTIGAGTTLALNATGTIEPSSGVANAGALTIASNKTIDSMTGAGTTALGANTLTIGDATGTSGVYTGIASGTGGITTAGTGTLTLGGVNAYTGGTVIGVGSTLALNAAGTIAASSGVANAGALTIAANKIIDSITGAGTTSLGAFFLTIGDASNTSSTYSGVISGTGGITKAGAGTLTLSGENSYSGLTTISAGTLQLGAAGNGTNTPLGTATGITTVAATGAALDLNGFTLSTAEPLTLNGTGISTGGALTNSSATATGFTGPITLATASSIAANAGDINLSSGAITLGALTLTLDGVGNGSVSNVIGGTGAVTKSGTGTWTVSGDNTYSGLTTIGAGTLKLGAAGDGTNTPLGTITGATSITAGAVLDLNGFSLSTLEPLTIRGTGLSGSGALTNTSGSSVNYDGLLTLGAAANITANAGDINITNAGIITGAGLGLTLDGSANGSIASIIGTTTGTLTKDGTGAWTVSGANTFTGATSVRDGTLKLGAAGAGANTPLGTTGGATTVASRATLDLNGFTLATAEGLTLNGTGVGGTAGALTNSSATATTYSGLIALGSNSSIVANNGDMVLSNAGTISGATFGLTLDGSNAASSLASIIGTTSGMVTKAGTGTWTLSGASTYTGLTTIAEGTLKLGANGAGANTPLGTVGAGTSVTSGATLDLNGFTLTTAEALTLNGTGVGGTAGALTNSSATTSGYSGLVTLGSDSSIVANNGNLVLSNAGTISGATFDLTLDGSNTASSLASIIGTTSGTLTKAGAGTWTLSGASTYTGLTTVGAGTLKLGANGAGANTPLGTVGAGTSVTSGATLDLNGFTLTTAEALTLNGTGVGGTAGALTNSSATASTYSGLVTLGSNSSIVANNGNLVLSNAGTISGATFDLTLDGSNTASSLASIIGTTSGTLTKAGAGTWTLSGASTYTGLTTVGAGTLKLGGNGAGANTPLGTVGAGTSVTSGATLDLNGFTLTTAEALTLNGTGVGGTAGALTNSSATTSGYSGLVTLGSDSSIVANNGNLVLSNAGTISGATFDLTLDGSNTASSLASIIGTTSGTLTKAGAGTWTLSGVNTYTGATTISAGTLALDATGTIAASSGVANAGTFTIAANKTIDSMSGAGATTLGVNTLTIGDADNSSSIYSGVISGSGGITKSGTGTLALSGASTYSGLTTIGAGTLTLGAAGDGTNTPLGTIGAGTLVGTGATLDLNGFTLSTAEALTLNGTGVGGTAGALTNSSATGVNFSGLVTLGSASSIVADAGDLNLTSTGTITGPTFGLTLDGSNTASSLASIIGTTSGTLTKAGAGTWTLSGVNTYTGATTISAGTLALDATGTIAASSSVANAGTFTIAANKTIDSMSGAGATTLGVNTLTIGDADNSSSSYTGIASGSGGITTAGAGTLTLGGVNAYTGATTIGAGSTLALNGTGTIAASSGVANAGTFTIAANKTIDSMSGAGATTLGVNTLTIGDADNSSSSYTGIASGSGGITTAGAGTLTLGGVNAYTGATTIGAGSTLALNGTGTIAASSGVANAGTFTIAANKTIDSMSGAGATTLGVNTLTIGDADNSSSSYSGVISGSGGITKEGTGTLTLSGANSYDGVTTINAGVIRAQSNTALGTASGGASVASGAALEIDGTGFTIAEAVTIAGSGVSNGGAIRNLTGVNSLTGGVTLTGASRINSDAGTLSISTGNITGTAQNLSIGGAGNTTVSSNITTTSGSLTKDGAGTLNLSGTASSFSGAVTLSEGTTSVASLANAGGNSSLGAGNSITLGGATAGTLSYTGNTVSTDRAITIGGVGGGSIQVTTGGQALTLAGAVTGTAGTLTIDAGTSSVSMNNTANDFSTVLVSSGNAISLVDANALSLGASSMASLAAQTVSGDLTLTGNLSATGGGNSIVLAAAGNFDNTGTHTINPGAGRWLVYSTSPTGSVEGGLTAAAGSAMPRLYNRTYGSNAPASITEPGSHLIYSFQPGLTVTPDNHTKAYGANDPTQTFTTSAFVTDDSVTDTATTAGLTSFSRVAGESAGTHAITQGGFASNAGYGITFVTGNTLTVNAANLSASIANQSKTYGDNDPLLGGIGVTLGGVINNGAVSTWNGNVAVNDTGNVAVTLASLTRAVGETVAVYNITGSSFNALTGTSAANYSAPVALTGSPTLTIGQAALTASIANQNKTYGADDPSLPALTLSGQVNRTAVDWMANNTVINDLAGAKVDDTLASLTRAVGETVAVYNITGSSFNALTGTSAANYSAPVALTGSPTLTIGQAALTASIANQNKTYGADDPSLPALTLSGQVNRTAVDWMANNTVINDLAGAKVDDTLASLTRAVGETVAVYNITGSSFNALTGTSAANYSAPVALTGSPTLTIGQAALTASIANQNKTYGADDPSLPALTLSGQVNRTAVDWMANNTVINDLAGAKVDDTLASLTRAVGETVAVYNITGSSFNALTGTSAANYSAPVALTGSPTLTIGQAALTASIANQNKTYGADDPSLPALTLSGQVNRTAVDWMANNTVINDLAGAKVDDTLASLTRAVGETVAVYNITGSSFNALTGTSAANYSAPVALTGSPTLTIGQAALTASIANQNKTYGADDPSLPALTLSGQVNRTAVDWMANNTVINDLAGAKVDDTLASLTRAVGETVAVYNITGSSFNALTGTSAANYSAPVALTGSPTLTIGQAALTASIANQNKTYGADDPSLPALTLSGQVNRTAVDWMANNTVINDLAGAKVDDTLASLTRAVGETVAVYNITGSSFNALTGTSAANYSAPVALTGSPTLTIGQAALTASIANQNKTYGADDPSLPALTLSGQVNRTAVDWMANNTVINDLAGAKVDDTLASLTRAVGETVAVYNITGSSFNALTGTSAANYSAPVALTGSPTLTIGQAALTASIANQNKTYGADDPSLPALTLSGQVNRTAVDWMANNTVINDLAGAKVDDTLASLTRAVGETVAVYNITGSSFNALTGTSAANYSAPVALTGSPTLTIGQAALTASIANQNKTYGADDPSLPALTLSGQVNRTAVDWMANNTVINDLAGAKVDDTLASLTRAVGETVAVYNITGSSFNALTGTSAANYSAPVALTGSPTLTIGQAALTASIANQNKTYGDNDPLPGGIGVTLGGVINNGAVSTWNGNVAVNDTGNVAVTLASLARDAGETVAGGPYDITGAGFNALTGSAAGNYSAPSFTGTPTLSITPRNISVTAVAQSKTYGGADPSLTYAVGGSGLANNTGIGVVDTQATVFSGAQARAAGETVAGGPYAISQGTLAANGNYNVTGYTASQLTVNPASLSVTADNKQRPVGVANPLFTATYSGFVLGETPASLGGSLQFNTPATPASLQGLYSITPFGLASTNYSIAYVPGVLVVGAPIPTTLNNLLSANFYAFSYSVINPYASAVGGTGSIIVASGAEDFLNSLPPSASGSEEEPAAVGDTGTDGFQPIRSAPARRRDDDSDCFNRQPLTALKCR